MTARNRFPAALLRHPSGEVLGFVTIALLWLFACYWNLDKAFHMDDTGHMVIARWISDNPLHPMSGMLNWGADFEPIYKTNQPHLYFYLMALWASLFGWSELSMHALMSVFTLLAIYGLYRLARHSSPASPLVPTAFFALSPAFVVGQNSMVDVPVVAVWIAFYWTLLNPALTENRRYLFAGLLCSAAVLIKYSSLVLLPALFLHLILRRKYRQLGWAFLPVIALALWSAFNYWDYGGVHILGRSIGERTSTSPVLALSWLGILGAISPFAVITVIAMIYRSANVLVRLGFGLIAIFNVVTFAAICWYFIAVPADDVMINAALRWLFLVNGAALTALIAGYAAAKVAQGELKLDHLMLLYWIASSAVFIVFFAPFMATRHVMLSLPPIILLTYAWIVEGRVPRPLVAATVALGLLVTTLLATADDWYAGNYRKQAAFIVNNMPRQSTLWFNGNWGWQWYATQAGMNQISLLDDRPKPKPGDYIVSPQHVCCELPILGAFNTEPYAKVDIPRDSRASHFASWDFYLSDSQPWGYYHDPIDVILISRVVY
jgi:hypothetical protein